MMTRSVYWTAFYFLTCIAVKLVLSGQRCRMAPNWFVNGRNPIIENAAEGNVVVLSLVSSKSKKFLLHTLDALNNYGRHYSYVVQQKVKILVINGQGEKLPDDLIEYFQYIKIYDEPGNSVLFSKLRGRAWDVLVYDVCGRMQFRYVYPFSWLGFPFLSRAINYAIERYTHVCGYCTPLSVRRQLPAKIPPTVSSSYVPAEVVTIASENILPVVAGTHTTYSTEKVEKSEEEKTAMGHSSRTVADATIASVRTRNILPVEADINTTDSTEKVEKSEEKTAMGHNSKTVVEASTSSVRTRHILPVEADTNPTYTTDEVEKSEEENAAMGRNGKTVVEAYEASGRAHHPILGGETQYKQRMKPCNVATSVTSTDTRKEEIKSSNDVRGYIVARLDDYLKKQHSTSTRNAQTVSRDAIAVRGPSKNKNMEQEKQEEDYTPKSAKIPTTQSGNELTTKSLQLTDVLLRKRYTSTTAVPTTKPEGTTNDLNKEISEVNKELHEQIEKVQQIIEPITGHVVHRAQVNVETRSKWENNLLLDYILQNSVFKKK